MSGTPASVAKNDQGGLNALNSAIPLPYIDGHAHIFGQSLINSRPFHPQSKVAKVVFVQVGTQKTVEFSPNVTVKQWSTTRNGDDVVLIKTVFARGVIELGSDAAWPPVINQGTFEIEDHGIRAVTCGVDSGFSPGLAGAAAWGGDKMGDSFGKYAAGSEGENATELLRGVPGSRGRAAVALLLDFGYTPLALPIGQNAGTVSVGNRESAYYTNAPWYVGNRTFFEPDQLRETIESLAGVAGRFPGEVWPLAPFDPRRAATGWRDPADGSFDALKCVKDAVDNLGYVGVKLYSRCGWMPTNNSIMHGPVEGPKLDTAMDQLFSYLCEKDLPVLCHTSPTGFPPDGSILMPKLYMKDWGVAPADTTTYLRSGDASGNAEFLRWCREVAQRACANVYNYAHYVQNSASPYSWEPALARFPKLRLDFAHNGGELSVMGRYRDGSLSAECAAGGCLVPKLTALNSNPQVVKGKDFAAFFKAGCAQEAERLAGEVITATDGFFGEPQEFEDKTCTITSLGLHLGVDWLQSCSFDTIAKNRSEIHTEIMAAVPSVLASSAWQAAMRDWAAKYPDDWTTRIIQLVTKYENCYSDIAYLSGKDSQGFKRLLEAVTFDAVRGSDYEFDLCTPPQTRAANVLIKKTFIGTDWYMTEMDGMSAGDFWGRLLEVIPMTSRLWDRWATYNALNWLNLKARIPAMEAWYKKTNPGCKLPSWWPALIDYYNKPPK